MLKLQKVMGSLEVTLLCISVLCNGATAAQSSTQRTDPVALGNGTSIVGVKNSNFDAFNGIPFAEPPVGKLRFANPIKKTLPAGEFLALNQSQACIQPDLTDTTGQRLSGSEDCLYLNIYKPNTNQTKTNYDVLFYIHGGAYFLGSGSDAQYGPAYFMNNGSLILVTTQYRLNTLGFLATGDAASPGNYAMKDQTMALQWVKGNIKAFGGNPDSITIAGQSAGSGSVHMLQMSPSSKDLMKGVIAFSGSAIGPWNYPTEDPLNLTRRHAQLLNITDAETLNSTQLVEEMRKQTAEDLIRTVPLMKVFGIDPLTLYRPVIEPNNTQDPFLTESPYQALKGGRIAKVPTMFSVVSNEGAVRALSLINDPNQREKFNRDMGALIPLLMELKVNESTAKNLTKQIQERYNLTQGIGGNDSQIGLQRLFTDRSFYHPAYRTLQLHLNASDAPIFFHNFTYRGQNSFTDLDPQTVRRDYGVVHSDDLIYLFENRAAFPQGLDEKDKAASDRYVRHIVQFVLAQAPTGSVQCTQMSPMCNYLRFYKNETTGAMETDVRQDIDLDMIRFWDQTGEMPL